MLYGLWPDGLNYNARGPAFPPRERPMFILITIVGVVLPIIVGAGLWAYLLYLTEGADAARR